MQGTSTPLHPRPLVAIFARRPEPGRVKTRLAAEIGAEAALRFYTDTLHGVAARLAGDDRWDLALAVTPDDAVDQPGALPAGIPRIAQGDGDLGRRMMRLLATARPGRPVLIVGSDIPGITAAHVARAVAILDRAALVLGPAEDGGYWLIGAATPPPPGLFDGVRWSTAQALADTLARAAGLATGLADRLADVDTAADLAGLPPAAAGKPG